MFTISFCLPACCCDAAIMLPPVAEETFAGTAAPPDEGTTIGLAIVGAYGLPPVGVGVILFDRLGSDCSYKV
jgi:hypothetical protein